jgi:hypothetical protein
VPGARGLALHAVTRASEPLVVRSAPDLVSPWCAVHVLRFGVGPHAGEHDDRATADALTAPRRASIVALSICTTGIIHGTLSSR